MTLVEPINWLITCIGSFYFSLPSHSSQLTFLATNESQSSAEFALPLFSADIMSGRPIGSMSEWTEYLEWKITVHRAVTQLQSPQLLPHCLFHAEIAILASVVLRYFLQIRTPINWLGDSKPGFQVNNAIWYALDRVHAAIGRGRFWRSNCTHAEKCTSIQQAVFGDLWWHTSPQWCLAKTRPRPAAVPDAVRAAVRNRLQLKICGDGFL